MLRSTAKKWRNSEDRGCKEFGFKFQFILFLNTLTVIGRFLMYTMVVCCRQSPVISKSKLALLASQE
uniref:Uncharacterized protein n=1 Tax=Glossina pallidipes TaxID=7398 RepID=A0A1A9Z4N0_GLOPL